MAVATTTVPAAVCARCAATLNGYYITVDGIDYCGKCGHGEAYAPRKTTNAPAELVEFFQRCKAMRMRQNKGEFVASDGTRMPYDFVFERDEKPARKGDDE